MLRQTRRAGLNPRNAVAWAGTEAAGSLGAGVAVAVRKGMGRNLRARPALCNSPGLRRGYARVVVLLVRCRRSRPALCCAAHWSTNSAPGGTLRPV